MSKVIKVKETTRFLQFKGEPRGHLAFNLKTDDHGNVEFFIETILDNKYRFNLKNDEIRELKGFLDLVCLKQTEGA